MKLIRLLGSLILIVGLQTNTLAGCCGLDPTQCKTGFSQSPCENGNTHVYMIINSDMKDICVCNKESGKTHCISAQMECWFVHYVEWCNGTISETWDMELVTTKGLPFSSQYNCPGSSTTSASLDHLDTLIKLASAKPEPTGLLARILSYFPQTPVLAFICP